MVRKWKAYSYICTQALAMHPYNLTYPSPSVTSAHRPPIQLDTSISLSYICTQTTHTTWLIHLPQLHLHTDHPYNLTHPSPSVISVHRPPIQLDTSISLSYICTQPSHSTWHIHLPQLHLHTAHPYNLTHPSPSLTSSHRPPPIQLDTSISLSYIFTQPTYTTWYIHLKEFLPLISSLISWVWKLEQNRPK